MSNMILFENKVTRQDNNRSTQLTNKLNCGY